MAVSLDGKYLFAANASADAVAVFDLAGSKRADNKARRPVGFIPTGWYPTALASTRSELLIATAKGRGTGPNNMPQRDAPADSPRRDRTYIGTLLYGSFSRVEMNELKVHLADDTEEVLRDN